MSDEVEPIAWLPGYPAELTEQAFLDDGTPVVFRAIHPDDAARVERLFHRLSPQARYMRFFTSIARPSASMIRYLVTLDYVDRLAIVAEIRGEIVGVARYDRLAAVAPPAVPMDPAEAEAAVVVEDAWQGRGIATRLLWRLSSAAVNRGVHTFTATILAQNRAMMRLLTVLGENMSTELSGGEYTVKLRLAGAPPPRAEQDAPGDSAHP
ncbi:MAG: GNAT family N-acetyltransferase [Nitriliruptorales bacterium]|nr:GNAT family N-acetyltransferase [Nitriliruptorales bacterium]